MTVGKEYIHGLRLTSRSIKYIYGLSLVRTFSIRVFPVALTAGNPAEIRTDRSRWPALRSRARQRLWTFIQWQRV